MADKKISQLTDGTSFQSGDEAVVNRGGVNFKVDPTVGVIQQTDIGTDPNQLPLNQYLGSMAYQDLDAVSITGGTVVVDGLTVDTDTLYVDAANNRVGIGTTSPKTTLNVSANNSGQGAILTIENADTSITTNDVIGQIDFYSNDASPNGAGAKVNIKAIATSSVGTATALTFGTSDLTSATAVEAMRIDASGNVGIGTSSPTTGLECINSDGQITGRSSKAANTNTSLRLMGGAYTGNTATAILLDGVSGSNRLYLGGGTGLGEPATFIAFMTGTAGSTGTGTERMRLDASGNLLVGTTTSPSDTGTIVADGVYLGGTGAANLLDDYEEGTFTPTITGTTAAGTGTYTVQIGEYTKVGDRVLVNISLRWTAHTGTGDMRISGLPFTVGGSADNFFIPSFLIYNITLSAGKVVTGYTQGGITAIKVEEIGTGGGVTSPVGMDTSGEIYVTLQYRV